MRNEEQIILKRAVQELLECEVGCVPPTAEIKKKHTFSKRFLERMDQMICRQEEKKILQFLRKNRRVAAACIACVIVAASCVAVVQSGMFRAGSSGPKSSDINMEEAENTAGEAMEAGGADAGAAYDTAVPSESESGAVDPAAESAQEPDIDDPMDGEQTVAGAFYSEVTACDEAQVTVLLTNNDPEPLTLQLLSIRKTDGAEAVVFGDANSDMCYLVEAESTTECTFDRASYGMEEPGIYVFEWVTSDEVTYLERYELN